MQCNHEIIRVRHELCTVKKPYNRNWKGNVRGTFCNIFLLYGDVKLRHDLELSTYQNYCHKHKHLAPEATLTTCSQLFRWSSPLTQIDRVAGGSVN